MLKAAQQQAVTGAKARITASGMGLDKYCRRKGSAGLALLMRSTVRTGF